MTSDFPVEVTEGRILFGVIRSAIRAANFNYSKKNERAILIWNDTIKDTDYFSSLHPWQVVNRLPSINIICRKAPLIRLIQRIQQFFPQLYDFLPKSYILPIQNSEFNQLVSKHEKKYIIKTDNGSLGLGITIIDEKKSYTPVSHLSIAQEYVESCLIDQTKFDCRIYVLVTSMENLQIYVYRGGVARFCSQKNGTNSIYSQITNTAVNRKNPGTTIDKITRMVTDTFEQLAKQGVDIELLWKKIDKIATLTILSAFSFLSKKEKKVCSNFGYSRCFQILGFDILIDNNFNPKLLEVNYRPSLDRETESESRMKCEMLSEAMKIAVPLNEIQKRISKNKTNYNENGWRNFIKANPTIMKEVDKQRKINIRESHFVQAYPSDDQQQNSLYNEIIQKVESLPSTTDKKYRLPLLATENDQVEIKASKSQPIKLPPINNNNNRSNQNEISFLQLSDSCSTSNQNLVKTPDNSPVKNPRISFITKIERNDDKKVINSPQQEFTKIEQKDNKKVINTPQQEFIKIEYNDDKKVINTPQREFTKIEQKDNKKVINTPQQEFAKIEYNDNKKVINTPQREFIKIEHNDNKKNVTISPLKNESLFQLSDSSISETYLTKKEKEKALSIISEIKSATTNAVKLTKPQSIQKSARSKPPSISPGANLRVDFDDQESSDDFKYYVLTEPDEEAIDDVKNKEIKKKNDINDDDEDKKSCRRTNCELVPSNNIREIVPSKSCNNNSTNDTIYFILGDTNQRLGSNVHISFANNEPRNVPICSKEKSYLPRLNSPVKSSPSGSNLIGDHKKETQKMPFIAKKYSLSGF